MDATLPLSLAPLCYSSVTVGHWRRVEFSSLIAREVRMGGLDVEAGRRADARFDAVDETFSVLLPTAEDFGLAKRYLGIAAGCAQKARHFTGRLVDFAGIWTGYPDLDAAALVAVSWAAASSRGRAISSPARPPKLSRHVQPPARGGARSAPRYRGDG